MSVMLVWTGLMSIGVMYGHRSGNLVAVAAVTSVSCNSQSKVQRLKRKPQTDRQQSAWARLLRLEQETAGVIILCSPRQLSSIITGRG